MVFHTIHHRVHHVTRLVPFSFPPRIKTYNNLYSFIFLPLKLFYSYIPIKSQILRIIFLIILFIDITFPKDYMFFYVLYLKSQIYDVLIYIDKLMYRLSRIIV